MSVFCGESLYSIPRGMDCDVRGDFYALLEHRTLQYRAGECFVTCGPCHCVRRKYSHHSRSWRRAGFLDAWLHWRSFQYPRRVLVCVRSYPGFRRGMDCWSEIFAGRHRSGGSSNGPGLMRKNRGNAGVAFPRLKMARTRPRKTSYSCSPSGVGAALVVPSPVPFL